MKEIIEQSLKFGISQYQHVLQGNFDYKKISLDCTKLPVSPTLPEEVKAYFFAPLHQMYKDDQEINRKTCVYFFFS